MIAPFQDPLILRMPSADLKVKDKDSKIKFMTIWSSYVELTVRQLVGDWLSVHIYLFGSSDKSQKAPK